MSEQWVMQTNAGAVAISERDALEIKAREMVATPRNAPTQCLHKTRHSFKSYNKHDTHTLQCCNPSGHDGAHQWRDTTTGRSVIWFNDGPPPDIDYSTRFRYFKDH